MIGHVAAQSADGRRSLRIKAPSAGSDDDITDRQAVGSEAVMYRITVNRLGHLSWTPAYRDLGFAAACLHVSGVPGGPGAAEVWIVWNQRPAPVVPTPLGSSPL